uniref:Uncharacterized protein n=1 Tax=Wuchereria bancrofti TaxID=6293 RepID=A0A1I8EQX0_WUCBA
MKVCHRILDVQILQFLFLRQHEDFTSRHHVSDRFGDGNAIRPVKMDKLFEFFTCLAFKYREMRGKCARKCVWSATLRLMKKYKMNFTSTTNKDLLAFYLHYNHSCKTHLHTSQNKSGMINLEYLLLA